MVKIRLQRVGAKKAPFYHIVVADSKSPRDGRIVEQIGTYNPMSNPSQIVLDQEKVSMWIKNGAKPTDTVKYLIEKSVSIVKVEEKTEKKTETEVETKTSKPTKTTAKNNK